MVQPWHHNNPNLLTRWTRMRAAPSGDWSVFQRIFADHWETFQHAHPRYQTPYYNGLVGKMLACGNPAKIGDMEYRCLHCGQGKHVVAMSCKSSLGLRCAKVAVDNWVSQVSRGLHEGVIYRHIILTVPAMFRTTFYQNPAVVLRAFIMCMRSIPASVLWAASKDPSPKGRKSDDMMTRCGPTNTARSPREGDTPQGPGEGSQPGVGDPTEKRDA